MREAISVMAVAEVVKKDLRKEFDFICNQIKQESISGSIELHFAQGHLAKIHYRQVIG